MQERTTAKTLQVVNFNTRDFKANIDIDHVIKVIAMPELSQAPAAPQYVIGLLNLAGMIIDVIDLSLLLNISTPTSYSTKIPILICKDKEGRYFGLIVEEVDEITTVTRDMIQLNIEKFNPKIVKGAIKYKDHISLMINVDNLLEEDINLTLYKSE